MGEKTETIQVPICAAGDSSSNPLDFSPDFTEYSTEMVDSGKD